MNLRDSITTALQALLVNKLRSGLTMLGIVIGVTSVILLVSIGRGHQANIISVFEGMGTNLIYVYATSEMTTAPTGTLEGLTLEDARAIRDRAPSVAMVAPELWNSAQIVSAKKRMATFIVGVTPEYQYVRDFLTTKGEFISEKHLRGKDNVVVLGDEAAKRLFDNENPVGKSIKINGRRFEVVGVLARKGAFGPMGMIDSVGMIPLTTMQAEMFGSTQNGKPVTAIAVQAKSSEELDSATHEISEVLRQRHHIKEDEEADFVILDMRQVIETMGKVIGIFAIFLGFVGGISLFVAAIGIMNIMLVSVTERTREIGLRKAVGARQKDILWQFLIEAATFSLCGGIVGVILAFIIAGLTSGTNLGGYPFKVLISADVVFAALIIAIIIGLFAGIYPARRAARLDPIEALRYE